MILNILLLLIGFVLLIYGADILVGGASSIARIAKMSELAIGLTIVSLGTSMPELVVNILSGSGGADDMALGNVIGSNIFNTLMILGVAAAIYPVTVQSSTVWKEIPINFLVGIIILLLANDEYVWGAVDSHMGRIDGIILLVLFAGFMIYAFTMVKEIPGLDTSMADTKIRGLPLSIMMIIGGLLGLFFGGQMVVDNAVEIAQEFGLSERLIGLTIISIGTSLPELATSGLAAYRHKSDIAIGNVVGSNLFNMLFILGASATAVPLTYNLSLNFDLIVFIVAVVTVFGHMFTLGRSKIDKTEGWVLIIMYVIYLVYLINTDG